MATEKNKTALRLNKRKCVSGIDGMNFEYKVALDGMEKLYLPEKELKNKAGNTIVKIDCVGGKIRVYINVVHSIRPNNVKPLGILESIKLELIQIQVIEFIEDYLQNHFEKQYSEEFINKLKGISLETNLTLPCVGGATPSDVIHLMDMVMDKTVVFKKRKVNSKCDKSNTSCLYLKPKEYRLKIYDKTDEQREKGNLYVEKNLLRIECVFIDRRLKRMFGDRRMLKDVLSAKAIEIMCKEYKKIFVEDIIPGIKAYVNNARDTLLESLTISNSGKEISETIARHKELIVDIEVLRKALRKWYRLRGVEDHSKQVVYKYRNKNLNLPEGVLQTIKVFHMATG